MFLQQKRIFSCLLVLIITTGALTRAASAENLYLAGFSGNDDSDYYGYIGAIIPAFGSTLADDGWRFRFWGSYLAFEYDGLSAGGATGTPTTFEGNGLGAEAAMGYRWSFSAKGKSTTYIGLTWRDIDVDPTDPGSNVENHNLGLKIQEEINYQLTNNIDVSLIASYTGAYDDAIWGRFRPGYTLNNGWKIGPEVILISGEVFDKQRYGAFLSGIKLGNLGIGISAGNEEEASTSDSAFYGAIGLSLVY